MAKISKFFENINVTSSGKELSHIIGGIKFLASGDLQQVVIRVISGSATSMNIELRYESGYNGKEKLIYFYENADLSSGYFIDSMIWAPFHLNNKKTDGDIYLYLEPDASCIVSVRLDFDLNNISGM